MTDPEQLSNWNLADIAEDRRLEGEAELTDEDIEAALAARTLEEQP